MNNNEEVKDESINNTMDNGMKISQVIEQQGFYISTISGISMYPMLRNRKDTVVLSVVKGRLKKYDLPLYIANGKYVLHRVIKVKPDGYIIRGDNCVQKENVRDEQIIGVMTEFYRGEKKVSAKNLWYRIYVRVWHVLYPVRYMFKVVKGKVYRGRLNRKKK